MHTLGPYQLLARIGVGGMAEIFLARRAQHVVALKRILPHLAVQPDFVDMFMDEARLAARLRHPNVARVLDVGRAGQTWYMAMEYVAGEDLLTIIRRARERHLPTPVPVALAILADAAAALHHAHELRDEDGQPLGIVHRDVTPSNLLVSHDGEVKLVDFGIAKAERRLSITGAGALKGKYAYMAPEYAIGDPVDRRADVFSLGVVAFELFTQRRLFHRETELAVLRAVTEDRIPAPSERRRDLPRGVDDLLGRALERDRDARFQTARHFELAARRLLDELGHADPRDEIAHFMDLVFEPQVADQKRRWAAGDLEEEPQTEVQFEPPARTEPRSYLPDPDEDLVPDGETTVATTPRGRLSTDLLFGGDTTIGSASGEVASVIAEGAETVPVRSTGSAPRLAPIGDATDGGLTALARPATPHMAPARPAFAPENTRDVLTEHVPRISGGSRWWQAVALVLVLGGAGGAIFYALSRDDAPPAVTPGLARLGEPPATLEAPQLDTSQKRVAGVARPAVHDAGEAEATATLSITGPAGATVSLDGEPLGVLPLAARAVPAGLHTLRVSGTEPAFTTSFAVELTRGGVLDLVVTVDPRTGAVTHGPRGGTP